MINDSSWKFLVVSILILFTTLQLGNTQISSTLIDGKSGIPIVSAIISDRDSLLAISDDNGSFQIPGMYNGDIWISHISYNDTIIFGAIHDTIFLTRSAILLDPITIRFDRTNNIRSMPNIAYIDSDVRLEHNRVATSQILNTVPGVFMHSGALNTNRITIRGIGSRNLFGTAKIKAYLNDIPLTNGVGETTIEDIDFSLINNISIVKGPSSSLFGAGLGGMILLSTRDNVNQNLVAIETGFGSYGLFTNSAEAQVNINQSNRLILKLNQTHSDGYRANNEYNRTGFSLIGEHILTPNINLTFLNNFIDLKANIPSSLNIEDFINQPRIAAPNWQSVNGFEDYTKWIWGVSSSYKTSENSVLKTSLFANDYQSYESRPFNILQEDSQSIGIRSTFLQKLDIADRPILSFEAGIEALNETYNWQIFETNSGEQGDLESNNDEKRNYHNLFLNIHLDLSSRVHVQSGINYNKTKYDYSDQFNPDLIDLSGQYDYDAIWSPYLNINFDISHNNPANSILLYGLISHGFSPPTLEETLYPDGQINPNIQPEQGINYEIGLKGNFSDNLKIDISGYAMTIKDLLVAKRTAADQYIGVNAGKTQHNGIEISGRYGYSIANSDFEIISSIALQDYEFKEFVDDGVNYSGNKLTGTPGYQIRTEIKSKLWNKFFLGFGNYSVGSQYLRDDNSINYDAYSIWHVFAKYKIEISSKWDIDLLGRIENLFNKDYASMLLINAGSFGPNLPRYYYPGLPRNVYLSAKLKHQF